MATPSPAPPQPQLPDALRSVLGSHQKLRLLCILDDGPQTTKDLAIAVEGTMRHQAINLHLAELERMGWIHVVGGAKHNPHHPLQWAITTPTGWRALADSINAHAPVGPNIQRPLSAERSMTEPASPYL